MARRLRVYIIIIPSIQLHPGARKHVRFAVCGVVCCKLCRPASGGRLCALPRSSSSTLEPGALHIFFPTEPLAEGGMLLEKARECVCGLSLLSHSVPPLGSGLGIRGVVFLPGG